MNRKILFSAGITIAAAWLPAAARPSKPVRCLVFGVGIWTPSPPSEIWRSSRHLHLLNTSDPNFTNFAGRHGWHDIQFISDESSAGTPASVSEYDSGWIWLAPTPDSLLLLRPAALSEGMEVRGAWSADTFRGRAQAFSDAIDMTNGVARTPRANAYGIAYDCTDSAAAAVATNAVERFRAADQPDRALAAHEDSAWTAELSKQRQAH